MDKRKTAFLLPLTQNNLAYGITKKEGNIMKKQKLVSLLAVSAMTVAMLSGCAGGSGSASSDAGAASSSAAAESSASPDAAADASQTPAADGASFKIGGIGPLTGSTAIYGMAVRNAAQMAVDDVNAAGGINGYQVELNFQDDEGDAEKAVNAYNTLKDWGAQMLMGCVTSTPSIAVSEKTMEDNMFQLTPSGSAVDCVKYDNVFRVCFADPAQGVMAAQYIKEHQLGSKVAVIYNSSDTYSTGLYESFNSEAKNQGLEIVTAEAFTADSNTDFSVQIQKAKDAGADIMFLPIYYTEASLILTQANAIGYTPAFFGCDGLDGLLGVENFDVSLAEGVMFLSPFATDANQASIDFTSAYEANYGDTPNQFAADGYDAIFIIKEALEQCGATPDMNASDLCEALKAAMTQITMDGLTGSSMTWTADGEPNKVPIGVKIENGVYTIM
jgi:branched-chain amino acid transport system substrate-binding protein